MSNGKTMDIEMVTRTILEKNPGLKANRLLEKVSKKTGKGRSAIYEAWEHLENQCKIYREKGCYYLEKPIIKEPPSKVGFFEYFDHRAERKRLEREQKAKQPTGNMIRTLALFEHCKNLGIPIDKEKQSFINTMTHAGIDIKTPSSALTSVQDTR